jgi:hypothetical protein
MTTKWEKILTGASWSLGKLSSPQAGLFQTKKFEKGWIE